MLVTIGSPTRGAIMTGRYPSHTGIGPAVIPPNAPYGMPKDETYLSEVLGAAGYKTAAIGKVRQPLPPSLPPSPPPSPSLSVSVSVSVFGTR